MKPLSLHNRQKSPGLPTCIPSCSPNLTLSLHYVDVVLLLYAPYRHSTTNLWHHTVSKSPNDDAFVCIRQVCRDLLILGDRRRVCIPVTSRARDSMSNLCVALSYARAQLSCRRRVCSSHAGNVSKLMNMIMRFTPTGSPGTIVFKTNFYTLGCRNLGYKSTHKST